MIDAAGKALPAHLALGPDRLEIRIDARGAAWPVAIDPIVVNEQAKLTAADSTPDDEFGYSVALWGDSALVGANGPDGNPSNAGAAYVFTRMDSTWSQQAKLTASDGSGGDDFGISVALSGDTALVGATLGDGNASLPGAAYVFELDTDGSAPSCDLNGDGTFNGRDILGTCSLLTAPFDWMRRGKKSVSPSQICNWLH